MAQLLMALVGLSVPQIATSADPPVRRAAGTVSPAHASAQYARLPLSFEKNQGQTDPRVKFLARGQGYTLFLATDEAVLALQQNLTSSAGARKSTVIRFELKGAEPDARIAGLEQLPGQSNYFIGNDPSRWRTHVPTYAKVRYSGLYHGIDLVYYGRQGRLEYDFVVAPSSDAGQIRLGVEGTQRIRVDREGGLMLEADGRVIHFSRPEAYQMFNGRRRNVVARYVLGGKGQVAFAVASYDHRRPLIIDPALAYATYVGGTGGDVAYGVAVVASSGNAYITGITNSTDFPTHTPEQSGNSGNGDAFVTKLNSTGTALIYSTYLGGKDSDTATAVAVDATGDAFVTGTTTSPDFPVTATSSSTATPFQSTYGGNGDAFVTEILSDGSKLSYSSYLGGAGADSGQGIAVDGSGNVYITGSTQSNNFPVINPLQPASGGGSDAFVTKVNFTGTALVYSTYLGGAGADVGQAIQVDNSGNAYVAGYTFSTNFPTLNPYQAANAGTGTADAFAAKVKSDGSALVYSTYLGGSGDDRAYGIAVDSGGNAYLAGATQSSNFPVTSVAFQSANRGASDAFVTKLNPGGSNVVYSTYLGGSGTDQGNGIAVDSAGDAYVTGFTQSTDFPTQAAVQGILGISGGSSCGNGICADAFVSQLNPAGGALIYSTYLGGSGADFGQAIALDPSGNAYVGGSTASTNFPAIAGAFQSTLAGAAGNAFVAQISPANSPAIALVPAKIDFGNQPESVRSPAQAVQVINEGTAPLTISSITSSSTDFQESDNCVGSVPASGGTCTINITFTPSSLTAETQTISIADNAANSPQTITVTGTGVAAATAVTITPTSLNFGNEAVGSVSASQTATITNTGTATLTITSISTNGDFVQTNTCGATQNILNVGQSCTISAAFQPTASGARNGNVSIADNASGSPQSIALSGTGIAQFVMTSSTPSVTAVVGTTSVNYTVSAAAPASFSGNITLSCPTGLTCTFTPATIAPGQSSTLALGGLSSSTANPFNFTVSGTSGSQTATVNLVLLLSDYSLTVSPALNTVTVGTPAPYTVIVTPLNGFNQQVNLSCTNLPPAATCTFAQGSVTPNGSPVSVKLTVNSNKGATAWLWPGLPFRGAPPPRRLWFLWMGALAAGLQFWKRYRARPATGRRAWSLTGSLAALALAVTLASGLSACRSATANYSATPTGNYTITITGTLNSNTTVTRTVVVNLALT
jgi:hypothetical protein